MKNKNKYTVLIADDEYWTREKLRNLIPWDKYELNLLEPAVDGEDAWEKITKYEPDILITDINMPFLNGVELLMQVQKNYPKMITFVISGYDDFEYVKGTFMAGSINYLVKPITKMDLVQALVLAMEKISENENERQELLRTTSAMQDREFSQMIRKQDVPLAPSFSVNGFGELAGMSLAMIKIHNLNDVLKKYAGDVSALSYSIKKEVKSVFQDEKLIVFNNIYRINEFLVITEVDAENLKRIAEKLRVKLSNQMRTLLTICITGHSYSLENIYQAYVEAVGLLMTRRYSMNDEIVIQDGKNDTSFRVHFNMDCERQLKHALASGKHDYVKEVMLKKTGFVSCVEEGWSYVEVKQTARQIVNAVMSYAINENNQKLLHEMENFGDNVERKVETLDYKILFDAIMDIFAYLIPEKQESTSDNMRNVIGQVVEWLDEHFVEEVSLTALADKYHVTSSYLSKVFRQETGVNLVMYITKKRMEKALEYIKENELNLTEISYLVGYDDYTYFSRVFKKHTGMTPREYRNQKEER